MKNIVAIGAGIGIFGFAIFLAFTAYLMKTPPSEDKVQAETVALADRPPAVDETVVSSPSPGGARSISDIEEAQAASAEVDLWQEDHRNPDTLFDGNPAKRLHANPDEVASLHVGQKLRLLIPQRDSSVEAEIASTHNLTPRTQVWRGQIVGGHPQDNIVVTRGQIETHITIATMDGTYSAIIDNATGETVMVDEADIITNQIPYEDGIAVDPLDHQPPLIVP